MSHHSLTGTGSTRWHGMAGINNCKSHRWDESSVASIKDCRTDDECCCNGCTSENARATQQARAPLKVVGCRSTSNIKRTSQIALRYARFWLDLGRRLARLPARPSARPACTLTPRKPRTVLFPLPSPAPAAGLRTSSVHARCLPPVHVCRPNLARSRQPRPVASATVLLLYRDSSYQSSLCLVLILPSHGG